MPLPLDPSEATTLPCKNKFALSVVIQKIKEILSDLAEITFPIPILKGGTGTTTTALTRVAFKLPTIDLDVGTIIDWSLSTNFYNAVTADKSYTMSNIADGLSIQLLVENTDDEEVQITFPMGVAWVGGASPLPIPSGESVLYSFTSVNGQYIGVSGPLHEPVVV